jgi:hypothetical protein
MTLRPVAPAPCVGSSDADRIDAARRRWLGASLALVLPLGFGGCALLAPREIGLSEAELLSALATRFPAQRRVMQIFDLKLARPRLKLLPADNLVAIALDVGLEDTLLHRRLDGGLGFTTALRYDAARRSVVLSGVRADAVGIDGLPQVLAGSVNSWGGLLAEQLLEGAVVRQLKPEELDRLRQAGRRPGTVNVTDHGVSLALEDVEASAR